MPMIFLNENLFVEALKNGDKNAYIYLIERFNKRLYGYAMVLTNDSAMAEDIIQNVYVRTWERRKKLHISSSLQNYLFRCVHNEFVNQYKKNQSTLNLEQKYFESLEMAVLNHDDNTFEKVILLITKEIQNLPPKCKQVFILSRYEGLTNIEIAAHLEVSVKTVEAQITKAFSTLRKEIEPKYRTVLFFNCSF